MANKSALAIYIRTYFLHETDNSADAYAFPLGLVEQHCMTAEHIIQKVLSCPSLHGFTDSYLASDLIGICADAVSIMLGKIKLTSRDKKKKILELYFVIACVTT